MAVCDRDADAQRLQLLTDLSYNLMVCYPVYKDELYIFGYMFQMRWDRREDGGLTL